MDELDNHPLSLLLLLNQDYFFQFLEWAQQMGWVEAILFLMEADMLRFKTDGRFRVREKISLSQSYHFLSNGNKNSLKRYFPLPPPQLSAVRRLVESKIPLAAGFSHICDTIWKGLLRQGSMLSTTQNAVWPSLRKFLLEKFNISMEDVLIDPNKRKYFEKFLQADPADLASLQCLVAVQRILDELSPYILQTLTATANSSSTSSPLKASYYSEKEDSHKDKKHSSILKRWRATTKATLNFTSPLSSNSAASASSSSSMTPEATRSATTIIYSDAYDAFRILLKGSRSLQKQFFPVANLASSTVSPSSVLGLNVMNRSRRTSSVSSVNSNVTMSSGGDRLGANLSQPSGASFSLQCHGLSEHLRMEISASLALNHAVRVEDIEIIDPSYANASCQILQGHLEQLREELLQFLRIKYSIFKESNEYIIMTAHDQALQCEEIRNYYGKVERLSEMMSTPSSGEAEGEEVIVHWADPRGRGVAFIRYADGREDGDLERERARRFMMNSCGNIVAETGEGGKIDGRHRIVIFTHRTADVYDD